MRPMLEIGFANISLQAVPWSSILDRHLDAARPLSSRAWPGTSIGCGNE
jgi:hypothetical protein